MSSFEVGDPLETFFYRVLQVISLNWILFDVRYDGKD